MPGEFITLIEKDYSEVYLTGSMCMLFSGLGPACEGQVTSAELFALHRKVSAKENTIFTMLQHSSIDEQCIFKCLMMAITNQQTLDTRAATVIVANLL